MLKRKEDCKGCIHYCEKESLSDKNIIEKTKFCKSWDKHAFRYLVWEYLYGYGGIEH